MTNEVVDTEPSDTINEAGHQDFGFWEWVGSQERGKLRFFAVCKCCGACKPPVLSPKDPPECPDCQDPPPWH